MPKTIAYKKELFDFINSLTAINNSIAFERVDDRVVVRKADKNRTVPYIVSVPAEYFDISDTIAFYKYDHFYRLLAGFKKTPELSVVDNQIVITRTGKHPMDVKYTLSDEEGIINGPKTVDFGAWDAVFTLSSEDLDEITKTNNSIKGNKAHISCVGDEITITIFSSGIDNSFVKVIDCERIDGSNISFDFVINSNRFDYLPTKRDYTVNISAKKFVNISLIHDEIEFNLYSGDAS